MTVKSSTTGVSRSAALSVPAVGSGPKPDQSPSALEADVLKQLPLRSPACVACAPGRLDLLGGSAEYTGSLIVNMPTAEHVCVAVQPRTDNELHILSSSLDRTAGDHSVVLEMSKLFAKGGEPIEPCDLARVYAPPNEHADHTIRCIVGTLAEMIRDRVVSRFDGGLTVVFESTLDGLVDAGRNASLSAAVLVAVAGANDISLEQQSAVALCTRVENEWLANPVGIGDAVCALLGETGALTQVRDRPFSLGRPVRLMDDLALVGVDSGVVHSDAAVKAARVRTAAFMGMAIIDRIVRFERTAPADSDGSLARVSVADYVERFRDRLPMRLKGREYLERFGETEDPLTRVEPDFVYKIRSRTEHHIYEHMRACRFVECVSRAMRNAGAVGLQEAGELMCASHWSYGQRCGLGSVETDLLANLIRQHGASTEIYGAKITGRGCGGVVAVLMKATDQTWNALDKATRAYESQSGRSVTLIRDSSPGALVRGARKIDSQ